jgi:hypothetical protein
MYKLNAVLLGVSWLSFSIFREWEYSWIIFLFTGCCIGCAIASLWKFQKIANEYMDFMKSIRDKIAKLTERCDDEAKWVDALRTTLQSSGWKQTFESDTNIGFSYEDSDGEIWNRDYDKNLRRFVQYNASMRVKLVPTDKS